MKNRFTTCQPSNGKANIAAQHSMTVLYALDPLMGRRKRPCPLPVQSRVNRVLAVIANRHHITKEICVRFDRRPSVNSAYSLPRASGADLRCVQKTMGHFTPTVTANIHSDLYSDELDHLATNLDRLHDSAANQANGRTGHTETSTECRRRVRAAQSQWPGAGSNRRPSAFQPGVIAGQARSC